MLEGFDIQLVGVAAPQLIRDFGFEPKTIGLLFSASLVGLFLGAVIGGRCERRWGASNVLTASMVVFGLFTTATVIAWNGPSLILLRLVTGIGLGAAMPNLILVVTETAPDQWRRTLATLLWAGTPIGGVLVSQCAAAGLSWQVMFMIGGVLPIAFAPAVKALIVDRRPGLVSGGESEKSVAVNAGSTARPTMIAAGLCFFCTLLMLYTLLNWLPFLLHDLGLSSRQAAQGAAIFNLGGLAGAMILALMLRIMSPGYLLPASYAVFALALFVLASPTSGPSMRLIAVGLCGAAVIGGQYSLYGIVGTLFPPDRRSRAVTLAVALGRLGALVGPLLAGLVLQFGFGSQTAVISLIPITVLAAIGSIMMVRLAALGSSPVA